MDPSSGSDMTAHKVSHKVGHLLRFPSAYFGRSTINLAWEHKNGHTGWPTYPSSSIFNYHQWIVK